MDTTMKYLTAISVLLLSSQAFAHHDHLISDSTMHMLQHGAFWGICAVIGYKGAKYFKNKRNNKNQIK